MSDKRRVFTKFNAIICVLVIAICAVFGYGVYITLTNRGLQTKSPEDLRAMSVQEIASMPKYDGRKYGIVTPTSDQGDSGLCWAYSSVCASETSILRSGIDKSATKKNLKLSPTGTGYARYNRGSDPLGNTIGVSIDKDWRQDGGNPFYSASLYSSWCGPTSATISYNENQYDNCRYKLVDAIHLDTNDVTEIKTAVATYGAVTFAFNADGISKYFNPNTGTDYEPNHGVTIIGWDDSISDKKFKPNKATQDGGWLVKNSWNVYPYFYISYDCAGDSKYAFDYVMYNDYDFNYFYNDAYEAKTVSSYYTRFSNVFEAKQGNAGVDEYIQAVNIGFWNNNTSFDIKIYTDVKQKYNPESGVLCEQLTCHFDYGGYRTVKLSKPIKIEKGSKFSIVVDLSGTEQRASLIFTNNNNSGGVLFADGNLWYPARNATAAIKAFTTTEVIASA